MPRGWVDPSEGQDHDPIVSVVLGEGEVDELCHLFGEPYVDARSTIGRANSLPAHYTHQLSSEE